MARGGWNSRAAAALLAAALLAPAPGRADYFARKRAQDWRSFNDRVWQAVFGERVVEAARRLLGSPYVWGGSDPRGFDCSGFTWYVFRGLGVPLARTALAQFGQGVGIDRAALIPGDLVFFTGVGAPLHVGIYVGGGRFLHAPGAGKTLRYGSLNSPYFRDRFVGARRVTPDLEAERARRAREGARGTSPAPRPAPTAPSSSP